MIGIDAREEQRDVSDALIEARLICRLDYLAQGDHVVHVHVAEFACAPGAALLPVKQTGVRPDKGAEHLSMSSWSRRLVATVSTTNLRSDSIRRIFTPVALKLPARHRNKHSWDVAA